MPADPAASSLAARTEARSASARPPMPALEKAGRVALYFAGLIGISLGIELFGHFWCLWSTLPRSAARVRRSNAIVRAWGTWLTDLTTSLLQGELDVRGQVPEGRFIVISNHQSTADIAILIRSLRPLECKFVAKSQLGWGLPCVSAALSRMGGALISRRPSRRDTQRLERMAAGLELWHGSAVLFPEGTRARDGSVRPYHSAAARIVARTAMLPLLPVAIDGTHVAADLPSFARRMPRARVRLTIGEPVPVERWDGRLDEALEDIRQWTIATIEAGRREGAVPPPSGWT